ncbi:MAG: hypothetical protein WC526_03735 [Patescibacteria group bacterium]
MRIPCPRPPRSIQDEVKVHEAIRDAKANSRLIFVVEVNPKTHEVSANAYWPAALPGWEKEYSLLGELKKMAVSVWRKVSRKQNNAQA